MSKIRFINEYDPSREYSFDERIRLLRLKAKPLNPSR